MARPSSKPVAMDPCWDFLGGSGVEYYMRIRLQPVVSGTIRWTGRSAIFAVAIALASYLYGEWYAFSTRAAQFEVWSAYLESEIRTQTLERSTRLSPEPTLVIQDHTEQAYRHWLLAIMWPAAIVSSNDNALSPRLPSLTRTTYVRYLLSTLRSSPVRSLKLSAPYRLASAAEVATYGRDTGEWEALFPRSMGFVVLSSVGFNADQTQALLKVDHFCGLCGHGGYVLLRKLDGRWVIEAEAGIWVS